MLHPAAGELPLWQLAQWAARSGATSWSNTGACVGSARSAEHAHVQATTDATAHLHLIATTTGYGRTGRLRGALAVSAKMES